MNKDEYTISEHRLEVDDHHTLYLQEWGNPQGHPIIFLHGGPGGKTKDSKKQLFDPEIHRVLFFDQRGSGKSLPYGSIESNTTQDLIGDISKIADYYKLSKFSLYGASWGSCLALAYAVERPEIVASLVITGVFTGTKQEIEWIDQGLFKTYYPEVWEEYLNDTPKGHQDNPSKYHFDRALKGSAKESKASAYAYNKLEGGVLRLDDRFTPEPYDDYDPAGTIIETHYLANQCFLPNNHIQDNAHKLTMPLHMVQGRYDMVCPPKTAFQLHENLPDSELITTLSGHIPEHEDVQLLRQALRSITK